MSTKIKFNIKYFTAFLILLILEVVIALFIRNVFVRYHFGDVLVVILMYCFIKSFIKYKINWLWLYIFIFATLIEIAQYFNYVELLGLGDYRIARVILGTTFDVGDIFCYAVGCAGIGIFEWLVYKNTSIIKLFLMDFFPKNARIGRIISISLYTIIIIHIANMFIFGKNIEYKKVAFRSAKISADMDGYSIVFITDLHNTSAKELQDIVQRVNSFQVDLLLLGGDYAFANETLRRSMELLSQVTTVDGVFGVEGSGVHDDYIKVFAAMEEYGIKPLPNNGMRLRENLFIAGIEDLQTRNPDIVKATLEASLDDFILLLAHNPDITMRQDTHHIDLILSGHTHGGQITFFGIWAPLFTFTNIITENGQRFVSGWSKSRDGTPVYVSNGICSYSPRIFARPQVIILTLRHKE